MSTVDGGTIEVKFLIDVAQLESAMSGATAAITKLKVAAGDTAPAVSKMGGAIDDSGAKATTNAVKFQTLAQGALNLTTSFAQAYTSISNLSRAQTSLQSAAVGVERAQDSLARTTYNLNKARNASTKDLEKINILMDRQTTQTDALEVAQRHLKDEQDRINDTYVLFAINLVNVGFSAIQTIKVMRDLSKEMSILNLLTNKYLLIALAVIAAWEVMAQGIKLVNKELGSQLSIIDNITRVMDKFGSASDITLKGYNSRINEAGESWEKLTGTINRESSKQTEIVRYWQSKQLESIIDTNNQVAKQFFNQKSGGQQVNPSQAPFKGAVSSKGGYFLLGTSLFISSGSNNPMNTNAIRATLASPFGALGSAINAIIPSNQIVRQGKGAVGPTYGPGEYNPNTRTFNPLLTSTRIRQDEYGRVFTSIIGESAINASTRQGEGAFVVANIPTNIQRYQTELDRTDYDLSKIDQQIFDANAAAQAGRGIDPTLNAILAGLREKKNILVTSKDILLQKIFDEQNRKTDSDFEFTPNTNFGASIAENNKERALNLRALADVHFANSELFTSTGQSIKAQAENIKGNLYARQAAQASQQAASEEFNYGTNTGRANQIAQVSRVLTLLQYSDPKSTGALDYAISLLGKTERSLAGRYNSTKLGSDKRSAIGGQAKAALGMLGDIGGVTSPAYKGFADAMKGLRGGLPPVFAKDPSKLVLGQTAYTASALGLVGGPVGSQATAMRYKGRLTQGKGKSSKHGNVFGSVVFSHTVNALAKYGNSPLGQTAQHLVRYIGGPGINFGTIDSSLYNFLSSEMSSLFPLLTDVPQTGQRSLDPFTTSLATLRQFREQVSSWVGLSFQNQSVIENDVMRQRNELENRVRYMQRLESASGGMTGF